MSLKEKIDADLKNAMLSGEKEVANVLRGLRSEMLNQEISSGKRDEGLSDEEIEKVVTKEIKKRNESIELYEKGGNDIAAGKERAEREILSDYLPQQLSDDELTKIIETEAENAGENPHMGKVIGAVKQKVGNKADGARIADKVKKVLNKN